MGADKFDEDADRRALVIGQDCAGSDFILWDTGGWEMILEKRERMLEFQVKHQVLKQHKV